ncbi:MAG: hypothetical protein JWR65_2370, partial [Massilia sp.]|nr:hypothetical protein [Massilia sp.]
MPGLRRLPQSANGNDQLPHQAGRRRGC